MARIAKSDVHAALQRAATNILDAAGDDGVVSRRNIRTKLKKLDGTEKVLTDMFYRFIDHRDAAPGARVSKADVEKAVTYAKEKLVDAYDLNSNGLSAAEIADMSRTGKLAVSLARELKNAAAVTSSGGTLPEAELVQRAANFIALHADDGYIDNPIFPRLDGGESGTYSFAFPGASGDKLAAFAALWFPGAEVLQDFDASKHMLMALRTTYDEEGLFVSVMDRATGEVTHVGEMGVVDLAYEMEQEDFERVMGPISQFGTEYFDDIDHYDLIDTLVESGTELQPPDPEELRAEGEGGTPGGPVRHTFDCYLGGSGPAPDLDIFGTDVVSYTTEVRDVGSLYAGPRFNPLFQQAGLSKASMRAVVTQLAEMLEEMSEDPSEVRGFEIYGVNKLYDGAGAHIGHEVEFGDERGIIGGSVFITTDGKTTYGYDS